jgi:hypothetical protein
MMAFISVRFGCRLLASLALIASLSVAEATAWAATAPAMTVRGTITAVTGDHLTIKTNAGSQLDVALRKDTVVRAITLADVSEIQPGRYIGTSAVPLADGSLKALEIHVFPPEMAGAGDGHRPWDLTPNSSMTNGMVGELVTSNGRTITVKYKGGEEKVVVPDNVPVVNIEPGDRSLLMPGTQVVLFAEKDAAGGLTARAISAGKDGVKPPM